MLTNLSWPGHVNDADLVASGQAQPRETEVYRQSTLFLFREPVGVYTGQRLYESGLTVVYVPGSAYDVHAPTSRLWVWDFRIA